MIESNLDYLICMLESLDDDRFGKLIRFIFDREDNKFINPYNTYKELFVNILLNNKDNIYKPIKLLRILFCYAIVTTGR